MTKKLLIVILILILSCTTVLAISYLEFSPKEIVTAETDFKYETRITLIRDGEIVQNRTFIDIPIGIAVWASNTCIENCTFIGCDDEGIVFFFSSGNNIVKNCVFYQCCDGIELQGSCNNSFINCVFLNNSHAGVDGLRYSNNNSFFNCVFYGNVMGVYFRESENMIFTDSVFYNNKYDKFFH